MAKPNLHPQAADSSVQRVSCLSQWKSILKRTIRIYQADNEMLQVFYKKVFCNRNATYNIVAQSHFTIT